MQNTITEFKYFKTRKPQIEMKNLCIKSKYQKGNYNL